MTNNGNKIRIDRHIEQFDPGLFDMPIYVDDPDLAMGIARLGITSPVFFRGEKNVSNFISQQTGMEMKKEENRNDTGQEKIVISVEPANLKKIDRLNNFNKNIFKRTPILLNIFLLNEMVATISFNDGTTIFNVIQQMYDIENSVSLEIEEKPVIVNPGMTKDGIVGLAIWQLKNWWSDFLKMDEKQDVPFRWNDLLKMKEEETVVPIIRYNLISSEPLQEFENEVHIIGCGALGSRMAKRSAQLLPNCLINLWDFDVVEDHNLANQWFGIDQIGIGKADACANLIDPLGQRTIVHGRWQGQKLSGIVLVCVDSMSVRREIWESTQKTPEVEILIEGRMGIDEGFVYSVQNPHKYTKGLYGKSLEGDGDRATTACGMPISVGATADVYCGLAMAQLIGWLKREATKSFYFRTRTADVFEIEN